MIGDTFWHNAYFFFEEEGDIAFLYISAGGCLLKTVLLDILCQNHKISALGSLVFFSI